MQSSSSTYEIEPSRAADVESRYRTIAGRRLAIIGALVVIGIVSFCLDIATGPSGLPVREVVDALVGRGEGPDSPTSVIVWEIRLPFAIMALLVGGALSLSGAEMQTILNNPLASPFTLGVSAAATLGAALAVVLGVGLPLPATWVVPANAFLFAFGSVLLLQLLSRMRGANGETLVLFGIALVFSFNALVALLQFIAGQEVLQNLVFWSMGSTSRAEWAHIRVMGLMMLAVLPFSFAAAWKLTALRLGEDRARSFGIDLGRLRFASLLRISLLSATAVAFVGTIGFVGLVGPHIARLLIGEDHRYLLPTSVLAGAVVMSTASILSKVLVPGVLLPTGIVTSLIGVPVFLSLVLSRRSPG